MNLGLGKLAPYSFARLSTLLAVDKKTVAIDLTIGEPKHTPPAFVLEELKKSIGEIAHYPTIKGLPLLREGICDWLIRRYKLPESSLNPERHVLPINGSREGLFSVTQCLVPQNQHRVVMMPNPFYQIYEGAAYLAGAEPWYMNCTEESDFLPDIGSVANSVWNRCSLMYVCSPNNPTGRSYPKDYWEKLLELSQKHDFILVSDECYSEIYQKNPPLGLLEVAFTLGHSSFQNCLVFNSLSKRSNLPGLRSGFVAGDEKLIEKFLLYRTYHGNAMPLFSQAASIFAWADETHVEKNRALYRKKFLQFIEAMPADLELKAAEGGFYLWLKTPCSDTEFVAKLYHEYRTLVLPGSFLARCHLGINPGNKHIRLALVPSIEDCVQAANQIKSSLQ